MHHIIKQTRIAAAILLTAGLFLAAQPLLAGPRTYRSSLPPGKLIPRMVDQLGAKGFRMTIRKVYNEKKENKQGFVFWLYPGKYHCEITFREYRPGKSKRAKGTLIRVFAQNTAVTNRFRIFFTKHMKMKEHGVTDSRIVDKQAGGL